MMISADVRAYVEEQIALIPGAAEMTAPQLATAIGAAEAKRVFDEAFAEPTTTDEA